MKKFYFILLIMCGFLMTPSTGLACGKHSGKHSCKKEMSQHQDDACCSSHKGSDGKHNGCDGKCGHKQCGCTSSICTAGTLLSSMFDIPKESTKSIIGKDIFYYSKLDLSSGFFSLWLIPKIS
jgi:hypothetical protein